MGKANKKAQVSIDFLSGFFIFIVVVGYIAFSIVGVFPRYISQSTENNLKIEAWQASENFMKMAEINGSLDTQAIAKVSLCYKYDYSNASSAGNYTRMKNILNISGQNSIHITVDNLFFGITDVGDSQYRSGTVSIGGTNYAVYVQNSSLYFNETRNSTGSWSGESVIFGNVAYDVFKISYEGDFVIFRKRIVDCGPNLPVYSANQIVRRYGVYNGGFAVVELAYWL